MSLFQLLFGFRGRVGRLTYWVAGLVPMVVLVAIVFAVFAAANSGGDELSPAGAAVLGAGFLAAMWISFAVQVKRWHDRDKSAVWVAMNFVPYVGSLWVLVECGFLAGTPGPNRYDLDPEDRAGLDAAMQDEIVARVVRRDVGAAAPERPADAAPASSAGGWSRPAGWQGGAPGGRGAPTFGRRGL